MPFMPFMQISRKISESSPGTKPLRKDSLLSKQAMLVPARRAHQQILPKQLARLRLVVHDGDTDQHVKRPSSPKQFDCNKYIINEGSM